MRRVILSILVLALFVCSAKAQLLYKISGNGLSKPSYIVGTFHLAPATIIDEIPGVREALNSVEQVCGEIDLLGAIAPEYLEQIYVRGLLPFSLRIDDVLSESEMARLNAYMREKFGADFTDEEVYEAMSMMRPSDLVSSFTNMVFAESIPNYEEGNFMDIYFQSEAQRQGKECIALETIEFQMEMLHGPIIMKEECEQLMFIVDQTEIFEQCVRLMVEGYYSQNIRRLARAMVAISGNEEESFDDVMVVSRNNNWIEQMPRIMAEKSTLFYVGAAHLPKKCGMIRLLRRAGYKVTPVKNKKQVS